MNFENLAHTIITVEDLMCIAHDAQYMKTTQTIARQLNDFLVDNDLLRHVLPQNQNQEIMIITALSVFAIMEHVNTSENDTNEFDTIINDH